MAKRPTINTLANTASPTYLTQLNQNFTNVQTQFDNTLSLDGSTPNAMNADIDLNGNDLINAGSVNTATLRIGGQVVNPSETVVVGSVAVKKEFETVALLLADTGTYTNYAAGDYFRVVNGGFTYQVAASGASDHHVTTAGGVKLYVLPGNEGASIAAFGGDTAGVSSAQAAVQSAASGNMSVAVGDGLYQIASTVAMAVPKSFKGNGSLSRFITTGGFTGPMFSIAPAVGTDPKGWTISDFEVTNSGSATHVFYLDIASAGEYVSKLTLSKVISNTQVSSYFFEMSNPLPNLDGFFTSVISDNWSFGGYYLGNVGDSVVLERNTTTGAGVGYYVNQLSTAANVTIRDGNCTSAGGALQMVKGANLIFEGMQVECPVTFTGADNAAVSINRPSGGSIYNVKILNNNINTQGNPLYCIYLKNAVGTIIDGNDLYCDPSTGAHIYLDTGAQDTVIGNNRYYNRNTGAEIDPIIVNNGTGTRGVWVDATLTLSGWTNQNTANEHPTGYFLDRNGNVMLRGRVAGAATVGGETLFTLPVGYRPKTKGYLIGTYGAAGAATSVVLQIIPTGAVQILTAGATGVYLSGVVFSTR